MATQPQRQMAATKLGLIAVFLGTFAAIAATPPFRRRHKKALDLPLTDVALLAMATYRLGRLVAFDQVLEPVRAPVAETVPDPSGAGEVVVPRGKGARQALGELITCPICAGTWIAAGLVYALHLFPSPTRLFLLINSTMGSVELLNAVTESLSWTGEAARKATGQKS
ncbi:MAG: DUF1360 domain-containing protein [Anaerolineales bacterium]